MIVRAEKVINNYGAVTKLSLEVFPNEFLLRSSAIILLEN